MEREPGRGYPPWAAYAVWTAALAGGCLAWLVVIAVIGAATSLACGGGDCRHGEDLAWLGAAVTWPAGFLVVGTAVAVGWRAGRRSPASRRRWFRVATLALLATVLIGVTSLATLPTGRRHDGGRTGGTSRGT